jgi:hypothetical protein
MNSNDLLALEQVAIVICRLSTITPSGVNFPAVQNIEIHITARHISFCSTRRSVRRHTDFHRGCGCRLTAGKILS